MRRINNLLRSPLLAWIFDVELLLELLRTSRTSPSSPEILCWPIP